MQEKLLYKIKEILVYYAKENMVIEYGKLSRELGGFISPENLNKPLGEISYRCIRQGYPPLSVLVVSKDIGMPGEGFFTWIAEKMGFHELPGEEWENFYEEQKQKVFDCTSWDSFLSIYNPAKKNISSIVETNNRNFSDTALQNEIKEKNYVIGKETPYYILTIKRFLETQKNGPYEYEVYLIEEHRVVQKTFVSDSEKRKLLSPAKKKGYELLFAHYPLVNIDEVSMVHYKQDRQKSIPWENEPNKDFYDNFNKLNKTRLAHIVKNDVLADQSQNLSFYKDGQVKEYYGNRYERNAKNRLRAIQIHGTICKVCNFNFEEKYGSHGKDFIEVHHIKPLSTVGEAIEIDPKKDLVPVCSNCHRMLHRKRDSVLSIDELRKLLIK